MTPSIKALKAALERYESFPGPTAAKALSQAATAAVAEAEEQFAEIVEADPGQPGLF